MPSLERRHKHFVTDTSESADGQFRVDVILLWAVNEVIPRLGTYLGHRGGTPAAPRHTTLWSSVRSPLWWRTSPGVGCLSAASWSSHGTPATCSAGGWPRCSWSRSR